MRLALLRQVEVRGPRKAQYRGRTGCRRDDPLRRAAVSAASKKARATREACARRRIFKSSSRADRAVIPSPFSRETNYVKFADVGRRARGNSCYDGYFRARRNDPEPAPAPRRHAVVIHLPNVPLHTEVVVEVNKKGQVVRVKSTKPCKVAVV